MIKKFAAVVLLVCMLSGCASTKQFGGSAGLQLLSDGDLPAPTIADYRGTERAYAIGPFDRLRIDVVGLPELSLLDVQTDAGGNIGVPLAGSISVAGLSPTEAAELIRARLRAAHVRDPKVAVNLRESVSQIVTIEGQVTRPGLYPALGNMTLLGIVAKAEGTGEFANSEEVAIFRSVGGKRYAALYDLRAIRRGAYPDPAVYANDKIVVGDSPQRRIFRDFLQVIPLLTTPLIVALQK